MLTPLELEILLHYYSSSDEFKTESRKTDDAIMRFIYDDIIEPLTETSPERLTNKGKAWVELVLNTPMPQQVWLDGNGNVILNMD